MWDPVPILDRSNPLDEQRLRAGLRVVLPAERADRAAESLLGADEPLSGLRQLALDLETEQWLRKATRWLPRIGRSPVSPTAFHLDDLTPRSALMLIAHVGAGVDGEQLEDAFGLDAVAVGDDLLMARATFGDASVTACPEFGWIVGRYRDRTLPAEERLRFLSHIAGCRGCEQALEHAQQADARLTAKIDQHLLQIPDGHASNGRTRSRFRMDRLALVAAVVAGLLLLLAGVSAISGLFTSQQQVTPLFAAEPDLPSELDGWLLQVSPVGYLEAINLETGRKRGLDSGDGGGFSPLYRVSRTYIAAWRPSDGQRDDVLTIGRIGEQPSHRMTWNRHTVYWYPSGWLNDHTLLIVKSPEHVSGETEREYVERLTTESRLIAFDARTGDERVLMTGNVAAAYPSPDGTMLAILHPIDRDWPGKTLELRPIDGDHVGEPVAQIDNRLIADGFWLADSSAYITSLISDPTVNRLESIRGSTLTEHGVREIALVRVAADGRQQTLETTQVPETIVPLGASPDARSLVYQVRDALPEPGFGGAVAFDWQVRQRPLAGGESVLLTAGTSPERVFAPTWSPDGSTLLLSVAKAFPLSTDGRIDQPTNPNATTLLVFDRDWQPGDSPQAIYSSGRDLYGWLPPDAIDQRPGGDMTGSRALAMLEAASTELDHVALGRSSVATINGSYIVAHERSDRAPMIWSVQGQRFRRLDAKITDLSWFNRGSVTIGVGEDLDGIAGSRIVLTVANISSSSAFLDHRIYDPANLGDSPSQRYAQPTVSPDGNTVSFFVDDRSSGAVTLWLDGADDAARQVMSWQLPSERLVDAQIIAQWADSDTLLLAIPVDWRDGLPRRMAFLRVSNVTADSPTVVELATLDPIRSAEGVELVEMSLSPDLTMLAYRLRHIDDATAGSGSVDTIHVGQTERLDRAIELERGGNGEGLGWSASSDAVIAGVRGRVARYSPDGRDLTYLSPRGVGATSPLVVGDQVWFDATTDGTNEIWQIPLSDD